MNSWPLLVILLLLSTGFGLYYQSSTGVIRRKSGCRFRQRSLVAHMGPGQQFCNFLPPSAPPAGLLRR